MRRTTKVLIVTTLLMCIPEQLRAETYINPWAGVAFGNNQFASSFRGVGFSFGSASGQLLGTEAGIGFTPGFFGDDVENYVFDFMTGITVGPTLAGSKHARPYLAAGIGTLRTSISARTADLKNSTRNDIGINLGGGATIDFTTRLGLRGDVRYYRGLSDANPANALDVDLGHFHFWRVSVGVMIW